MAMLLLGLHKPLPLNCNSHCPGVNTDIPASLLTSLPFFFLISFPFLFAYLKLAHSRPSASPSSPRPPLTPHRPCLHTVLSTRTPCLYNSSDTQSVSLTLANSMLRDALISLAYSQCTPKDKTLSVLASTGSTSSGCLPNPC